MRHHPVLAFQNWLPAWLAAVVFTFILLTFYATFFGGLVFRGR
jgi:hypothetical protein